MITTTSASSSSGLRITFGAACKPHPSKLAKGGEDAYFGCRGSEGSDGFSCFGVSDGVGGSATETIDPGVFSRELLRRCHLALTAEGDLPATVLDAGLGRWMELALQETGAGLAAAVPRIEGSATLLLGGLEPGTGVLTIYNIGDCGVIVLRPAPRRFPLATGEAAWGPQGLRLGKPVRHWPRPVLRTSDQTHFFNCPYQLDARSMAAVVGHPFYISSTPPIFDVVSAVLHPGDVVIAATDGVLDNLFDTDLQSLVAKFVKVLSHGDDADDSADDSAYLRDGVVLAAMAETIAAEAQRVGHIQADDDRGQKQLAPTPFSESAELEGLRLGGGKLDDVALVCGVVRQSDEGPAAAPTLSNFVAGST